MHVPRGVLPHKTKFIVVGRMYIFYLHTHADRIYRALYDHDKFGEHTTPRGRRVSRL